MNEENHSMNDLESARNRMQNLWNQLQNCGTKLYVDGKAVSPGEAAARTVMEDSPYMADYVMGEYGTVKEIRFDKVTHQ